ncbi:MAG: Fic family protein [Comamonas sp.]|nr:MULTISPECIES: Fic family protein [Comamonas]MPS90076.1 Fic family protein [Comamonas sp.]
MSISERKEAILNAVKAAPSPVRPSTLMDSIASSRASLNRDLKSLADAGLLQIQGKGRSTRYVEGVDPNEPPKARRRWSTAATALLQSLSTPPATRPQVQYDLSFLTAYTPNLCSLLPPQLALHLFHAGYCGQASSVHAEPAEQPLKELAWSSACLDGISMRLDDAKLLLNGQPHADGLSRDALVLLNHQDALDYVRAIAAEQDLSAATIIDVQALLMRDLVDAKLIGSIRARPIYGCDYAPSHDPAILQSLLESIGRKAQQIHNPIEAAFFTWVNLSYLQPFNFGNGATARLAANVPLLHKNCAPLSFQGVGRADYELALSGIYQKRDVRAAVELFEFVYRKSAQSFQQ